MTLRARIKDYGREEYLDGAMSQFAIYVPDDSAVYLTGVFDNKECAALVLRTINRYLKEKG